MTEEIENFVAEVRDHYKDLIIGDSRRVERGQALWEQFERAAVVCCADDNADTRQLTERTNELAVAKVLLDDTTITEPISYEPNLLPDDRKIDFVVARGNENIYVEVKTVHPRTDDTDEAWERYIRRKEHHPETVNFIVEREWMGGALYGNTFASRSHFLEYSLEFESRLAAAKLIKGGPGILVFCGNGFAWNCSDLEDFADFYHSGVHRPDDPFALMEKHHIEDHGVQILRNIDHFAFLKRAVTQAERQQFTFPVRGPRYSVPTVEV
jgi:hypothetical protein